MQTFSFPQYINNKGQEQLWHFILLFCILLLKCISTHVHKFDYVNGLTLNYGLLYELSQLQMDCLGCCTSFKDGERLKILESLTVQFKNYSLPIKEEKSIKTLLKTIISFLNSKGGTIYIGVEDNKGEVKGVQLFQKEKKEFQSFLNNLLSNITPKVTMGSQAQIKLQIVPVVSRLGFESKYVVKIIIQQGDPSQYYCYVQKIALQTENDQVEHEILYGFFRHNMGGVEQCKGLNLLKQIRNKALNPITVCPTFHKNCNPEPLSFAQQICTLHLKGVKQNESKQIQQFFEDQFIKQKLSFSSLYKEDKQTLLMKFEKIAEFQALKVNLRQNIVILNLTFEKFEFQVTDQYQKQLIINKKDKFSSPKKQPYVKKQQQNTKSNKKEENFHKKKQNYEEDIKTSQSKHFQSKKMPFEKQAKIQPNPNRQKNRDDNFPKKYCITFTNLATNLVDEFVSAIDLNFLTKDKRIVKYKNSIEVFLKNQIIQIEFYKFIHQNRDALKAFGYGQKYVIYGANAGCIGIKNFNPHTKKKLLDYLAQNLKEITEFMDYMEGPKKQSKPQIACRFRNKVQACYWLDELMNNNHIKEKFSIPGSQNKLKFMLIVDKVQICQ